MTVPSGVILKDVKSFLNIDAEETAFDGEIIPFIMGAIGEIIQNGRCKMVGINDESVWSMIVNDDEYLTTRDEVLMHIPLFVMMRVKVLFDPPPPSTVQFYHNRIEMTLWRIRAIFETTEPNLVEPTPPPVIEPIPEETTPPIVEPVPEEPIVDENIIEEGDEQNEG